MNSTCWQYLLKVEAQSLNHCPPAHIHTSEVICRQITYTEAKEFILQYEWMGNMGTSKLCFGLFLGESLTAVCCFGPTVAPTKLNNILNGASVIQLCRGASAWWAPKWAPSKLIGWCLRWLYVNSDFYCAVAYADPVAGEIGTIYQACNALYLGLTDPKHSCYYIINGHKYDPRKVVAKFGSRKKTFIANIDPYFETIPINKKHRYLFIIGPRKRSKRIISELRPMIQPYPKR